MAGASLVQKLKRKFQNPVGLCLLNLVNALGGNSNFASRTLRPAILRLGGARIGADVVIRKMEINGKISNLSIGRNTWINRNSLLDCNGTVKLGSYVGIGSCLSVISSSHEIGHGRSRCGEHILYQAVAIMDGTWVGSNCVIGSNLTVEDGCVISAGTVLQKSIPKNSVVAGNPGRIISTIEDDIMKDY